MTISGRIGEHYEIVELLGSGAMGEVYRAIDRKMFDRAVAIKFLSERLTDNAEGRARFRREVETSARLHHPNIVTIYDWGEHLGRDFFVMEFVEGRDLQGLLRAGISWDLEQRLEVAFQLADALDFAHRAGVIHRDVKPGNVMVVLTDSGPRVKLVDFGIAHVERSNLTQAQSAPGTFSYMSPEQLRGDELDPLDPRRDLFSLGIVLCELFSGHHPFEARSEALIISRLLHDEPVPLSRHGADVPPELESLILRMLKKVPDGRPGTAREVADAIRDLLRKVVARSAGPPDGTVAAQGVRREFVVPRMKEVDSALDAGNVQEALAILSEILRKYPDQADAATMLDRLVQVAAGGIAYGDYRAAVREASAALRGGDLEAASVSLQRATMIWPDGPELPAIQSELSAAETDKSERVRRRQEEVERTVDGARSLLRKARSFNPVSPDETKRAVEALGKAVNDLDPARTDHPAAGGLREKLLAQIAAFEKVLADRRSEPPPEERRPEEQRSEEQRPEERPPEVRRPEGRRARMGAIAVGGAILLGLGAFAVWKLVPQSIVNEPYAEEIERAARRPENSLKEITDKLASFRLIDSLLASNDSQKARLAREEDRLATLHEMDVDVERLKVFLDQVSEPKAKAGDAAKILNYAKEVWRLFHEQHSKLANDYPNDPTAARLDEQGRSILSKIEAQAGSRPVSGATESR